MEINKKIIDILKAYKIDVKQEYFKLKTPVIIYGLDGAKFQSHINRYTDEKFISFTIKYNGWHCLLQVFSNGSPAFSISRTDSASVYSTGAFNKYIFENDINSIDDFYNVIKLILDRNQLIVASSIGFKNEFINKFSFEEKKLYFDDSYFW